MSLDNGAAADDSLNGAGSDGAELGAVNGSAVSSGSDAGAAAPNNTMTKDSGESFVMRDYLRSRDYDIPDTMHDDALLEYFEGLGAKAQRFEGLGDVDPAELQRYADIGRRLGPYEAQIEQLRQHAQQSGQQTQQRAQAAAPASAAQPPAQSGMVVSGGTGGNQPAGNRFDRDAIQAAQGTCRKNAETGLWEPLQPFYADAAKFLNDAEQLARRNSERLLLDPDGWMDEGFTTRSQKLREELRQEILQELMPDIESWREFRMNQLRQEFLSPIEAELIASHDAATGQPTLTPKGMAFDKAYLEAPQGLSEIDRLKYAKAMADQWELQQSRQPAGQATAFTFAKNKPGTTPAKPAPQQPGQRAEAGDGSDRPRDRRGRFIDAARHAQTNGAGALPTQDRAATVRAAARRVGNREPLPTYEELLEKNSRELGH